MKTTMKLMMVALLGLSLAACAGHYKNKMNEGLGTLLQSKLKLDAQQVQEIDALTEGKMADFKQRNMQLMRQLIELDTEAVDYAEQSASLANQAGNMLEQDVLDFAQTRVKVLALLTDEQKQKLEAMREKMTKRFAKHQPVAADKE